MVVGNSLFHYMHMGHSDAYATWLLSGRKYDKIILCHSMAGWGIGGSVIAADCGVQSPFVGAMGCRYLRCAT